jgi:elongation factor P--beta-lysine ligase
MKNTKIYNELVQKMRNFFLEKGFIEVPTQSRLSILKEVWERLRVIFSPSAFS